MSSRHRKRQPIAEKAGLQASKPDNMDSTTDKKPKSRTSQHQRKNERIFLVGLAIPENIQERVLAVQSFLTETPKIQLPKSTLFRAADHITLATIRTKLPDDELKTALFEATKTPKPEVQLKGAGVIRSPNWSNLCIKVISTRRLLDARNSVAGVLGDTEGIELIGHAKKDFQPHITFASLTKKAAARDQSGLFRDDGKSIKKLLHGQLSGQFIAQAIFAAQRDETYHDKPSQNQNAWHIDFQ